MTMDVLEEYDVNGKIIYVPPNALSPDTNKVLGHKLDFESDDYAENVGKTPAIEDFDFEDEKYIEKEGDTPESKETGVNVKKRPLNSPA